MAKLTLKSKSINESSWILFGSEDLFRVFMRVCKKWIKGALPDPSGKITKKDCPTDSPRSNMFRVFEGLKEEDIISILERVERGEVLLKKSDDELMLSGMGDVAQESKYLATLKEDIKNYYVLTFPDSFDPKTEWINIFKTLLFSDDELTTIQKMCDKKYLVSLICSNEKPIMPQPVKNHIRNFYFKICGGDPTAMHRLFQIIYSDSLLGNCEPSLDTLESRVCTLAIVDMTRPNMNNWTQVEISNFLKNIVNIPSNETIVIAMFVPPRPLVFAHILESVKELPNPYSSYLEYGSYLRDNQKIRTSEFVQGEMDILLFVGITQVTTADWRNYFEGFPGHYLHGEADYNEVHSWSKPDTTGLDKGMAKATLRQNQQDRFVRRVAFDPRIGKMLNSFSKPSRIIRDIISNFSKENEVVLDLFSGGQVLQNAILLQQNYYAFCNSIEYATLQTYANDLATHAADIRNSPTALLSLARSTTAVST
ncbi:unnamed protein product [Calypogeia fissa]